MLQVVTAAQRSGTPCKATVYTQVMELLPALELPHPTLPLKEDKGG
ncbi:hypothetical protein H6G74_23420 [Nostoc spongiaeforme FACHB-130]|uniref:Transposase n=1 Tax=Nostoc spongiaeforme FACHB-130 TaxID=1357510 RepID=A0ABR8G231_9NOSO|nr:hypothetical protein [Nostoc spongiaeforme]MBD2597250.1 hypothetical protein [Nostoc spongiaeforme FACHB-130]